MVEDITGNTLRAGFRPRKTITAYELALRQLLEHHDARGRLGDVTRLDDPTFHLLGTRGPGPGGGRPRLPVVETRVPVLELRQAKALTQQGRANLEVVDVGQPAHHLAEEPGPEPARQLPAARALDNIVTGHVVSGRGRVSGRDGRSPGGSRAAPASTLLWTLSPATAYFAGGRR